MQDHTTVAVSHETHALLQENCPKGTSYDEFIRELMEE